MGISIDNLAATYPRLYHITSAGTWPSILRHGLLSTEALLNLFGVESQLRESILGARRPEFVQIEHPEHGRAIIRDQKPLIESRLRDVLQGGMTPREWYRLLNRKAFFWVAEERFETLRTARAYQDLRQTLIVIDSAKLLARHAERVTLCPINSGATRPMAWPRGRSSFLPMAEYPFEELRKKRGRKKAVVELTVEHSVPDIRDLVISVSELGGAIPERTVWP
uniref:Uncharacterized protein n=1 Tax=Solibacter usitatus (strain Ellin6076) TaxID=234267 RepID=Q01T18_SOLUE